MTNQSPRLIVTLTRLVGDYRKIDDAALLGRYQSSQDAAAFDELVHRHGPLVLGVCRRMLGHVHDADDAFQATFLVLVQNARSIRKPNALAAWLYGAAVRVCKKALARRGTPPLPTRLSGSKDPLDDVARKEILGLLDEELTRLSVAHRDPLVLCYIKGLTCDEAATRLGWSRRTLMRRLDEGRDRLRLRLTKRGVDSFGLGAFVLSPVGLKACVPEGLTTAAVTLGIGGTAPLAVRALAGGAAIKLLYFAAGLLLLVATGGGIGLAVAGWGGSGQVTPSVKAAPPIEPRRVVAQAESPRLDGDGQPLPEGAVHRLGSRRFRIEGLNNFTMPSPDGKHVVVQPDPHTTGYQAQGLMLIDVDTGLRVRAFEDSRRVPIADHPAVFSPDGKTLYAVADDKLEEIRYGVHDARADMDAQRTMFVWDVATGKLKAEWALPPGNSLGQSLFAVDITPDGMRLLVSGSVRIQRKGNTAVGIRGLHVIDATTGKHLGTWENAGHSVGMTVGGKEVITFDRGMEITAHNAESGKALRTFPLAGNDVRVAISSDGATVAAASGSGKTGKLALQVRLWEAATGREIRRLTPDAENVVSRPASLIFAEDGKTLYLGTFAGSILRWDLSDGKALPGWQAHGDWIKTLFPRPGKNELISVGWKDATLRRWDSATGKAVSTTEAYSGGLVVAQTPDRKELAICDWTGRVDIWDIATARLARTLRLPADKNRVLEFNPDGSSLLDATDNGKIMIRDPATGKAIGEIPWAEPQIKGQNNGSTDMTFSPDGRGLLLSNYGFGVRLLTWPDCKVVWQYPKAFYGVFLLDGRRILSGYWHSDIHLRDAKSGAELTQLAGQAMTSAAFSPDGRLMLIGHLGGRQEFREGFRIGQKRLPAVWQVRDGTTGTVLREVKESQEIWCVAMAPSGRLVAVASDNSVRVYETASWQQVARFDGHAGTVRSLFFGRDDATLVSVSSEDGTALVWSLKPLSSREPPDPAKLWVALSGDGPAVRRAVWAAAEHPDTAIRLFRSKWPIPKERPDPRLVAKLIEELGNVSYAKREAAMAELANLGRHAEDALRKASTEPPSVEVKQRADKLLARWGLPAKAEYPVEEARELRAVWALELAGTPAARKLLTEWATAKVGNRLCEEAAMALKRLEGR